MRILITGLLLLLTTAAAADVVVLWDETAYQGIVATMDAASLTLQQKGREIRFDREEVAQVLFTPAGAVLSGANELPDEDTGVNTLFGNTGRHRGWLVGRFYRINRSQDVLPDFSTLTPHATLLYTPGLNVPKQRPRNMSPFGYAYSDFAIQYTGTFTATASDTWVIELTSDDGARLYIDDVPVIDNDGSHGPVAKTATVTIGRGTHRVRVDWFQDGSEVALILKIGRPGAALQVWNFTEPLGG